MPNLLLGVIRWTVTATWLVEDQSFFLCRLGPHNYSSHLNPAAFTPASLSGLSLELFFLIRMRISSPEHHQEPLLNVQLSQKNLSRNFKRIPFWFHSLSLQRWFFSAYYHISNYACTTARLYCLQCDETLKAMGFTSFVFLNPSPLSEGCGVRPICEWQVFLFSKESYIFFPFGFPSEMVAAPKTTVIFLCTLARSHAEQTGTVIMLTSYHPCGMWPSISLSFCSSMDLQSFRLKCPKSKNVLLSAFECSRSERL